jgi:hypothetical protein
LITWKQWNFHTVNFKNRLLSVLDLKIKAIALDWLQQEKKHIINGQKNEFLKLSYFNCKIFD